MDNIKYSFSNLNYNSTTHTEVPATSDTPTPQVRPMPTLYDYLTLLPVLITALTPLILGLKNKGKNDENVNDSSG